MFLMLKFNLNLSMQTLVCVILIALYISLLNTYKISLRGGAHLISAVALLFALVISGIGADFQTNVRDNVFALGTSLFAALAITFIPYKSRRNVMLVPVFGGLLIFIIISTALSGDNIRNFLSSDAFERLTLDITAVSGYLTLVFPLALFFAYKNRGRKIFTFLALAVFGGVLITRSFNAIILASFCFVLYALFSFKKYKALKIVLISGYCLIFLKTLFSSIRQNAYGFQIALEMLKGNMARGIGFGNYGAFFDYYSYNAPVGAHVNNVFLEFLTTAGILGLAALVLYLCVFYIAVSRKIEKDSLALFITISATSFIIYNTASASFFWPSNMFLFFVVTMCTFKTRKTRRPMVAIKPFKAKLLAIMPFKNATKPVKGNIASARLRSGMPFYLRAVLFVILAVLVSKPMFADRFAAMAVEHYIRGNYTRSTLLLNNAVILDPKNPTFLLRLANSYFGMFSVTRNIKYLFLALDANIEAAERFRHSRAISDSLYNYYAILEELKVYYPFLF